MSDAEATGTDRPKPQPSLTERMLAPAVFVSVAASALVAGYALNSRLDPSLSITFVQKQDIWLSLAVLVILAASLWRLPAAAPLPRLTGRRAGLCIALSAALAWAGHFLVLFGYDMSRDEQMASFDALIFASGHLVARLPDLWAPHADALNTLFMLPVADRIAWVSGYLPMNAAIRSLFVPFGAMSLVGPLAVLVAGAALWGCARKLWPEDRQSAVLALLLFLGSGQVLVNGMTSYAMPLHLAANLVWLWLFLQDRRRADLAALAVAFVAVGLHQPVFHPMFAFPILLGVVRARRWGRAALFLAGYAAIGCFWFLWPNYATGLTGTLLPKGQEGYFFRLFHELFFGQPGGLPEMVANIIRFATWQHVLLLPLFLVGLRGLARKSLMGGLAGGIGLTLAVMAIILPYQGHGFGYRYLHGLIGNAILIAVLGWQKLRDTAPGVNALIRRGTLASLLVLIPMQAWFAHAFYAPFATASREIDGYDADYVLVEWTGAPFVGDLVLNRPDVSNHPVRLIADLVDAPLLAKICSDGATVMRLPDTAYNGIRQYFGLSAYDPAVRGKDALPALIRENGCVFR